MSNSNESPVALIGGVGGSIGLELAQQLTSKGWRIAGFGRDAGRLDAAREKIDGLQTYTADATDGAAVKGVVDQVVADFDRIDAYVHCVGSIIIKAGHQTSEEEFAQTMQTNLTSAFLALRACVPAMLKQKSGCMAFVSTVAAVAGVPNHEAIAAAKGGLNGLVRSAAATYANKGLRFNAVAPALVESSLSQPIIGSEQGRMISERMNPMGHIGEPREVASLLTYLVSPEASWVTGQVWSIDGGMAHLNQRPKI